MILRSRFAPSPTGLLHIGNARSAVINWAHALSHSGEFILRIDDTDLERSKKEFEDSIKNDLNWLGLKWSKTFKQSERLKKYYEKIDYLKKINRLYPCFETAEELSLKRKSLLAAIEIGTPRNGSLGGQPNPLEVAVPVQIFVFNIAIM